MNIGLGEEPQLFEPRVSVLFKMSSESLSYLISQLHTAKNFCKIGLQHSPLVFGSISSRYGDGPVHVLNRLHSKLLGWEKCQQYARCRIPKGCCCDEEDADVAKVADPRRFSSSQE